MRFVHLVLGVASTIVLLLLAWTTVASATGDPWVHTQCGDDDDHHSTENITWSACDLFIADDNNFDFQYPKDIGEDHSIVLPALDPATGYPQYGGSTIDGTKTTYSAASFAKWFAPSAAAGHYLMPLRRASDSHTWHFEDGRPTFYPLGPTVTNYAMACCTGIDMSKVLPAAKL
jgi:hypothetical protein